MLSFIVWSLDMRNEHNCSIKIIIYLILLYVGVLGHLCKHENFTQSDFERVYQRTVLCSPQSAKVPALVSLSKALLA